MTSEQYKSLLRELARVGGLADPTPLLDHGRVKIGEVNVLLEHEPNYDENLLQVRMLLGGFPPENHDITRALLEANYISGYGGECVFSLFPQSDDVVVTMKMRLDSSMSPQDLWQQLSDVAAHGSRMWEAIVSAASPVQRALPMHPLAAHTAQI